MSTVYFDIETDGLDATVVHCICAMKDDSTVYNFIGEEAVANFKKWLDTEECSLLVGHNIIGFDIPVLRKLSSYSWDYPIRDTLVLSRLVNPSLEGGHSLKAGAFEIATKAGNQSESFLYLWKTKVPSFPYTLIQKRMSQSNSLPNALHRHQGTVIVFPLVH